MADRFADRFLPQLGMWDERTGLMTGGRLFAMLHVAGLGSDLTSARAMVAARDQLNLTWMNLADPNLEVWVHFVRAEQRAPTALPPCRSWFARRLDAAYRACLSDGLYRNDLFVSFVLKPELDVREMLAKLVRRGPKAPRNLPVAKRAVVQDFQDLVGKAEAELARYGVRRLGIRRENGRTFLEMAEALYYVLHGHARPIGTIAATGRMGRLICPSRPTFGHAAYKLSNDLGAHVGAVLSFMDYPEPVHPAMFEALVRAPFAFSMTQSFMPRSRAKAMGRLVFKERQLKSANDPARSQVAAIERAKDELQSRAYVTGSHHFALAVRAPTLEALDKAANDAGTLLSNAGITVARENEALRPAFYAQLFGNGQWRARPGGINSRNFASLAALNNVPVGQPSSRWGAPVLMLRTTANTEYALHFQAQGSPSIPAGDLGNILEIGRSGSGKTGLMGGLITLSERQGVQRLVVDKDMGLAPCVEANGGDYLVLPANEDTGVAPLLAARDTPAWQAHLQDLAIDMIQAGGDPAKPYELTSDEDARLRRAIEMQVQMPPELRGFGGIQAMLGQRSKDGAAARLRKWVRGERLGWAVDGRRDVLREGNDLAGFDTTALLRNTMVAGPLLRHLFFRMDQRVTGAPLLICIDEFWQASSKPVFLAETNDKAKTGRKREVALILATQSAHDALNSPIAHTLKQQFPTKIFFGDDEADADELIDGLGLTVPEYKAVTQILPRLRHGFLIKRPGASVICRFDLSKALDFVSVLSGRDTTYALMRRLQAEHGRSPELWVPHFMRLAPALAKQPPITVEKPIYEDA